MLNSNKKAAMEISMSWIFMIIIGGFFLILAFNIVGKYQENENLKFEFQLKQGIRNALNDAGRTSGIEQDSIKKIGPIFKDSKVEIECYKGFAKLNINEITDDSNAYLRNYPTFMTTIEQGKTENSYIVVENFRLPFKITNMLAIVSKKNLIILNENDKITKKLLKKFNENSYKGNLYYISEDFNNLDYHKIRAKTRNENLNSIVFVSDKETPEKIFPALDEIITNLNIYTSWVQIDDSTYGEIIIKDKEASETFNFYDYDKSYSLQTMALFSKREVFKCSYEQLINSIDISYEFYIQKSDYLKNKSVNEQICSSSLSKEIQEVRYNQLKKKLEETQKQIFDEKFNKLDETQIKLDELKYQLEFIDDFNCPYVY
ncbi:MAG: hypothetical protein KC589_10615 [Nanoarchaeota archaeon]|nr:hypothetical protein [Nanoarchaeota archaeon]